MKSRNYYPDIFSKCQFDLLQILAMDVNREDYEIGLPILKKAGVTHKIDFREGPAMPVLDQLIKDVSNQTFPLSLFESSDCVRLSPGKVPWILRFHLRGR